MSVTPMKLMTFVGPMTQLDAVVRTCIIDQEFHPEQVLRLIHDAKGLRPFTVSNPYAPLLRQAERLLDELSVPPGYVPFQERDDLSAETAQAYLDRLSQSLGGLRQRQEELELHAAQAKETASQLEYLKSLSVDLRQLMNVDFVRFRHGYLPREAYDSFLTSLHNRDNIFFIPTEVGLERVYGIYFTTKAARDEADALFNAQHFVRIQIDGQLEGTPAEAIARLTQRSQELNDALRALEEERSALRAQEQESLLSCWSYLCFQNSCCDVLRYGACSRGTFYLTGWVPADCVPALLERAQALPGLSCVTSDADELEELEKLTPPTKLKNGFFARVFRPFLEMYGLPNYWEIDPSLFLSITYVLFFGIMFGDIGQGLVLAMIGFFLARRKNWLGNIMICCGLSGALFGCAYGSVFGFEELLPGFKILHGQNVTTLLLFSLGLGMVMLALVMLFNIVNGVRQRNWEKILFGPNGAAGMVFYLGLIAAALAAVLGGVNLFVPAYILPVLVLPLVLILLREPLSKLLSGDPHWHDASWGSVVGLGFFELFETLLSYLTNTLSFLRVAAYAITHVGLMLVIQALAGAGSNPVVLVLGNLFVIGFEGLLVGIQVLRLEFYELFGRFYDDGGLAYTPQTVNYTARDI